MHKIYLSRRNLLTLLNKLDRKKMGDETHCTILKRDPGHPDYPQTLDEVCVTAVEDDDYYVDRSPGAIHPLDEPK
jgi:hypothetical protein